MLKTILKIYFTGCFKQYQTRTLVAIGSGSLHYVCYIILDFACSCDLWWQVCIIKGSLDEKLPIYERDPKSKRLDSFEKRFVRD